MQGMQNSRKYLCLLALCLVLGTVVSAEWRDRFGPPRETTLSEILSAPDMWLDIPVKIHLRFARLEQVYNPFFTEFSRESHINFMAWDVQTPIWEKEGFHKAYPYFYVPKDNPELRTFLRLQTFDSISIYGKISGIFRGQPYIKVIWVCRLPGELNIYNLRLINKAMIAFKKKDFAGAITYFEAVQTTNPPYDIRAMIHKTIAKIHMYEYQDFMKAEMELDKAEDFIANDPELASLYDLCAKYTQQGGLPPGVRPDPSDIGPNEVGKIPQDAKAQPAPTKEKEAKAALPEKAPDSLQPEDDGEFGDEVEPK